MNVGVGMFAAGEFENLVVRRNLVHFSVSGAPGFTGHVAIPTVVDVVQA
jgi:hypothetical protein